MLTCQKVDLCCLQETRWRGGLGCLVKGKDCICKFFWSKIQFGFGGVGIMLAKKWVKNASYVTRYDHHCLQLHFLVGTMIVNIISCYAPQSALWTEEKDTFYSKIISWVAATPDEEKLLIGEDFNGHVGEHYVGFEDVHGGNGYGAIN